MVEDYNKIKIKKVGVISVLSSAVSEGTWTLDKGTKTNPTLNKPEILLPHKIINWALKNFPGDESFILNWAINKTHRKTSHTPYERFFIVID